MKEYTIAISNQAQNDYDNIFDYIAIRSLERAKSFTSKLLAKIKTLKKDALRGTPDKPNHCRFIIEKPYLIYYDVDENTLGVEIVHIRHEKQAPFRRC